MAAPYKAFCATFAFLYVYTIVNVSPLDAAYRAAMVFISVAVGLLAAKYLLRHLERVAAPISRRTGVPASLVALAVADARTPHAILARALGEGRVDMRHIVQYTFATWPIRVVLLHLRIGVIPIALGALGLLGAAYLAVVYLSSALGFLLATRIRAKWPDVTADVAKTPTVKILRQAASITARYAVFEAVFMALEALGVAVPMEWLPISPEAALVASISAVRPTYGIMAAAPLYHAERLTPLEVLIALVAGRVAYMTIYEFPRSAVQFYASIYPPAVAAKLTGYTALVMYATALPALAALVALHIMVNK